MISVAEHPSVSAVSVKAWALHGWALHMPASWELLRSAGNWGKGDLVMIADRLPRLAISWQRLGHGVDQVATSAALDKQMAKEGAVRLGSSALRAPQVEGSLLSWQTPHGVRYAAVLYSAQRGISLVLRDLLPGHEDLLRRMAASVVLGEREQLPWRVNELAVDVGWRWRLQALQELVGLSRAVWFHHPNLPANERGPDAVLAMRRIAAASMALGDTQGNLVAWMRQRLRRGEREVACSCTMVAQREIHQIELDSPAATWWRRVRGQRARRIISGYVDSECDRLVLAEWYGSNQPMRLRWIAGPDAAPMVLAVDDPHAGMVPHAFA